MAGSKKRKAGWKVKRTKSNEAVITLPEGMKFTNRKLSIDDIVEAIQKHAVIADGKPGEEPSSIVVKCCGGNTALA